MFAIKWTQLFVPSGGVINMVRTSFIYLTGDKISQPKKFGGLGIKKFKCMNQAMLNKKY